VETAFDEQMMTLASQSSDRFGMPGDVEPVLPQEAQQMVRALERAFGQILAIIDCASGNPLRTGPHALSLDLYKRLSSCEIVAQRGRAEIIEEVSPLLLMAVPLVTASPENPLVALMLLVTEQVGQDSQIAAAAHEFGLEPRQALRWAKSQPVWMPHAIQEVGAAIVEKAALQQTNAQLKRQLADISSHLLMTFEEITLLHRLTERLSIAKSVTDLCELSVNWLADVIPARSVAIWFESMGELHEGHGLGHGSADEAVLIVHGNSPLEQQEFSKFIERLGPRVASEPLVLNRVATGCPTWFYPEVREIISVPIREGNRLFGWMLALNHTGAGDITNSEAEFGTVEACLMSSVATILGIHCGNIALYHEQSEFFSSVVRALTSAIDAKDPYTCGHSDRVARLSVCIARELGCSSDELNTIYLSGLLHDIGKIGIDDTVLRKPGPLTPAEIEHIKTHPELGCRILDGVKQLDSVLPIVRHHHEAWNGNGYPAKLQGEDCPFLARVVAVADSIDAMSSDRPYRKGMSDEKLDSILREGAGNQWDAKIVDAAFAVRDEIRLIGQSDRKPLSLQVDRWKSELAIEQTI
jgi:HD-GYP domain-containing protein (c-di-GMP phosphodiesterase class II)